MTPRVKLLPVGLVKTRRPVVRSSSTTIFVVVVLPFVPLMTTTPYGSSPSVRAKKAGSIFSTISPGSAEPPPLRRAARLARRPTRTTCLCNSTRLLYRVKLLAYSGTIKSMVIALLSWWYGAGWRRQVELVSAQLTRVLDTFSFELLLRTLFSPFRQLSVGQVQGSLAVQLQALLDRLVSRGIGAMIRTTMLIVGGIAVAVSAVAGVVRIALWPLWPVLPGAVLVGIVVVQTAGGL